MIPIISPPPQFEQLRMEPPRMEQPWFEQPRMELPRFEQPRMVPPCFEQPRMEPPRFEPRMEPPWMGPPQFGFHRAEPFQGQLEGFWVEPPQRFKPSGSRLGLNNLMSSETNLMCPHKTGEIGQEMIMMAETSLRRIYLIEELIWKKGIGI